MPQKATIKELKAEIRRLKRFAYRDELTGLLNRHGFKEETRRFLDEIVAYKKIQERRNMIIQNFSLILFDADNFKKINDEYGHAVGDQALKRIAEAVGDRIRHIDIAARWGGEEILVGLVGSSEQDAYEVAENIRRRIENIGLSFKGQKKPLTVSAGIASMDQAENFDELFEYADQAVYAAKKAGRNRSVKFSSL